MKKFLKATAAALAVSVALTACTAVENEPSEENKPSSVTTKGTEAVKIDEKALSLYESSPVTQVEKQPFTLNGYEGLYTGDWKGNRPEGQGKFVIGTYDYYSGKWYNGMLLGQGEIQRTYDDGTWKRFEGECAYNSPSGEGWMIIGSDNDPYCIEIEGDFGDESTLWCYKTDDVGKLVDIGGFVDGEYVSYVGNTDIEGISFTDWVRRRWEIEGISDTWEGYEGTYIGQTDENGVPNGYGYSVSSQFGTQFVYKLGTWKDGWIEGYYTEWRNDYSSWCERIGRIENRRDVGECVIYNEYSDYYKVRQINCDTSYDYTLCDDGIYRTDYVTDEYHYNDGRCEYQKYITFRYDMDDYRYYYEGTFAINDANGNVIKAGRADTKSSCSLSWLSNKQLAERELWDTMSPIIAVGAVVALAGVTVYSLCTWGNDFEGSAADKYLQRRAEESSYILSESRKYDELLRKAEEEERLGNTYNANKLREEAYEHKTYLDF